MHFETMEARHAAPHHHHIGASVLLHPLNDLIVQVSVVEVILVNSQPPWMGQTADHCHTACPVHSATLNLGKQERTENIKVITFLVKVYILNR